MGGSYSTHSQDPTVTDTKLAARVRDLIVRRESMDAEHIPFHRILLSFPTLRRTFSKLRVIYNDSVTASNSEGSSAASWAREATSLQKTVSSSISSATTSSSSSSSNMTRSEVTPPLLVSQNSALLRNSLKRVGSKGSSANDDFTDSQIKEIFDTVDFHHLHRLTYRQFLASLAMSYLFGLITLPKRKDRTGTSSRLSSRVTSRAHSRSHSRSGSRSPSEPSEKLQFSEESARALEGDTVAAAAVALEAAFALHDEAVKYVPAELTKSQTPAAVQLPPPHPPAHPQASKPAKETSNAAVEKKASFSILKKTTSHNGVEKGSNTANLPPKLTRSISSDSATVAQESSSLPPSPTNGLSSATSSSSSSSSSSSDAFGADLAHAFDMIFEAYCHLDVAKHGFLRKTDLAHGLHDVHEGSIDRSHSYSASSDGHSHLVTLPEVVRTRDITPEKPHGVRSSVENLSISGNVSDNHSAQSSLSRPPTSVLEFLTQERFLELDWNANGEVSFAEFLVTFVLWVGVEDDEEESKEEEKRKPNFATKSKSFIARLLKS